METQIPKRLEQVGQGNMDLINSMFAINDLIDYITELSTVIEKQQAQIDNLRGGWTDAEIKKAEVKTDYWFIADQGSIFHAKNRKGKAYEYRRKSGNVFDSKGEAKAKLKEIIGVNK
jgi:hypothetical protein